MRSHHWRGAVVVAPAPVYAPVPVFAAPRIIATAQIPVYRSYFAGVAYYAPHHHAHVVYRFPVETVHGIVYRPFTYCGDRLFAPRGTAVYVAAPSYDDGVSGFVQLGGPNFRIAFGF